MDGFMYIQRYIEKGIVKALKNFPVVAVTGPRQCGKSTLVKELANQLSRGKRRFSVEYLDLERPSDLRKIENTGWFFSTQKEKLICIDEIQRMPELFPLIRSLVDQWSMLAHVNGQTVNYATLAASLNFSSTLIKNYIALLS
jgi:predicted AAA+ superfamily ATPase